MLYMFLFGRVDDSTRSRISALIAKSPGLTRSELCQMMDLGWGTVSYHAAALLDEGSIVQRGVRWSRRLYPPDVTGPMRDWINALREDGEVLAVLAQHDALGVCELADLLGRDRKTLRRHLEHLGELGLVHRDEGREGKYGLGEPQLARAMLAAQRARLDCRHALDDALFLRRRD